MYLLDTMVLSEHSKTNPSASVLKWLRSARSDDCFLSVVTIGEIERGIAKLEARGSDRAADIRSWLETTSASFGDRILPVTMTIARRWGPLTVYLNHSGPDLFIAATALDHDLVVVTRNTRHFEPTGVKLLDPYLA